MEPIVALTNGAFPSGPQFWLDAANAAVRRFCGWHVAPQVVESMVLDGPGTKSLLIPSNHVVSITACTNDGVDVLNILEWSETGVLTLPTAWTRKNRGVTLTVEHGYEKAPDVAGLIVAIASRAATIPAGVASQNAGPMGVKYVTSKGAPVNVPLLASEKETLQPYKLNWGA